MTYLILFDVAPNPSETGGAVVVVVALFIIGFFLLLAAGLVVILWYRKRNMRGVEMIRLDTSLAAPAQPNNPNHP